jgi:hypothetical protein
VGFRKLKMNRILIVEMLDSGFVVNRDFNPANGQYLERVFHF